MENSSTLVPVVAAAIRGTGGRVLLQQRPRGKHHAGLWEFPGGKVEQGEDHPGALVREVEEELAIVLDPAALTLLGEAREAAGAQPEAGPRIIVLFLYNAPRWHGLPQGLEGQASGWFTPREAAFLPLAPMDRQLLSLIVQD